MEAPRVPKAMDDMEGCSPTHSNSLCSPCSQRSPKTPLSPSPRNPRWIKKFKLFSKSTDHSVRPDTFINRSRAGSARISLVAINSTVGDGECLAQTAKQWDTIIKQARADDKVPDVMKAAKFFYFGEVLRDPKPAQPSEAYVFVRRQSESEAREEVDGLPLPLKAYAADRRRKIRRRRRPDPAPVGSDDVNRQPAVSGYVATPHRKLSRATIGVHGQQGGSNMQISNTQSSPARKFKSGHDLGYLKFAAEEHLNDSELIKGIGRVPINRKTPEPIEPVEDKPWELPPDAWALRDFQFLLQKMISSDLNVNNHMILTSGSTLPTLDDPEALQLQWNGKTEQTISVFKGRQIKCVPFKDVIMIKYNRKESKILFQFSSEKSDKPEELLLILLPISDTDWQSLQTCCYSLAKGNPSKQKCDVEGQDFFDDKTKALMNLRVKRAPMVPFPNAPVPQFANRGVNVRQKPRRTSRPTFQTRLNHNPGLEATRSTPVEGFSAAQEPPSNFVADPKTPLNVLRHSSTNIVQGPDTRQVLNIDENNLGLNQSSLDNEKEVKADDSAPVTQDSNVDFEEDKDNGASDVEPEIKDSAPAGLYYKTILRSGFLNPVRMNDLVVRLRSDKEREIGGKRDKLDLFDGPWRIIEFDLPKNNYCMKISNDKNKGDRSDSPSSYQYDKVEVKKMLKTKVKLGFPREAHAIPWVELSRLLPITKLEDVHNGKLHASCWGVTELTAFKILQSEMASRNLEIFDPKYQNFEVKTPAEKLKEKSEGAEDNQDDEADEDTDEDELELPMHIVEIKSGIFVAIMEADSKAVDDGDSYLVEKLRSKRLRLFKLNSPEVRKKGLKTDEEDSWVKLLLKEMPQLAINRVVISEYKVHWAGWPDEDDTWDIGTGNIAKGFIDEYHALTDLLRGISIDTQVVNPKDMVFKDDLPKPGRGKPSGGSRLSAGSSGTARRRSTVSSATNTKTNNRGARVAKKDQDENMLDEDEDIAIAKVIQASLDDAKAEKTKAQLKALQKEMGVGTKRSSNFLAPDADIAAEDDRFMELDEQDGDEKNDVVMIEGDEVDSYSGEGRDDEGYEV